jgi:hypothetical protein
MAAIIEESGDSNIVYDSDAEIQERETERYIRDTQLETNSKLQVPFSRDYKKQLLEQAVLKHPLYNTMFKTIQADQNTELRATEFRDMVVERYLSVDDTVINDLGRNGKPVVPYIDITVLSSVVSGIRDQLSSDRNNIVFNADGTKNVVETARQVAEINGVSFEKALASELTGSYVHNSDTILGALGVTEISSSSIDMNVVKPIMNADIIFGDGFGSDIYKNNYLKQFLDKEDFYNSRVFADAAQEEQEESTLNDENAKYKTLCGIFGNLIELEIHELLSDIAVLDENSSDYKAKVAEIENLIAKNEDGKRFGAWIEKSGGFNKEGLTNFYKGFNYRYNQTIIKTKILNDISNHDNRVYIDKLTDANNNEKTKALSVLICGVISREDSIRKPTLKMLNKYVIGNVNLGDYYLRNGEEALRTYLFEQYKNITGKELDPDKDFSNIFREIGCLTNGTAIEDKAHNDKKRNGIKKSIIMAGGFPVPDEVTESENIMIAQSAIDTSREVKREMFKFTEQDLGTDPQRLEIGRYIDSFDLNNPGEVASLQELVLDLYKRDYARMNNGKKPKEKNGDFSKHCNFAVNSEYLKTIQYIKDNCPWVLEDIMEPENGDLKDATARNMVFKKDASKIINANYINNHTRRVSSMVNRVIDASSKGVRYQKELTEIIREYRDRQICLIEAEGRIANPALVPFDEMVETEKKYGVTAYGPNGEHDQKYFKENYNKKLQEFKDFIYSLPDQVILSGELFAFETGHDPKVAYNDENDVRYRLQKMYENPKEREKIILERKQLATARMKETLQKQRDKDAEEVNKRILKRRKSGKEQTNKDEDYSFRDRFRTKKYVLKDPYNEPTILERVGVRLYALRNKLSISLGNSNIKENSEEKGLVEYKPTLRDRLADRLKTPYEREQDYQIVLQKRINDLIESKKEVLGEVGKSKIEASLEKLVKVTHLYNPKAVEASLKGVNKIVNLYETKEQIIKDLNCSEEEVKKLDEMIDSIPLEKFGNVQRIIYTKEGVDTIKIIGNDNKTIAAYNEEKLGAEERENVLKLRNTETYNKDRLKEQVDIVHTVINKSDSDELSNIIEDRNDDIESSKAAYSKMTNKATISQEEQEKNATNVIDQQAEEKRKALEESGEKNIEEVQNTSPDVTSEIINDPVLDEMMGQTEDPAVKKEQEQVVQNGGGAVGFMQAQAANVKEEQAQNVQSNLVKEQEENAQPNLSEEQVETIQSNIVEDQKEDISNLEDTKDSIINQESKNNQTQNVQDKLAEKKDAFEESLRIDNTGNKLEHNAINKQGKQGDGTVLVTVSAGNNQEQSQETSSLS